MAAAVILRRAMENRDPLSTSQSNADEEDAEDVLGQIDFNLPPVECRVR